jgi:hypothetical protein
MITFDRKQFQTDSVGISLIKERITQNTCKTNVSSQLMFRQSFTGLTGKLFVGNWTSNGFWISKFRLQFIQLRPDIITRFYIENEAPYEKVTMKSSIGFSSLFVGLIWMILFSVPFASFFGLTGFLVAFAIMVFFYSLLTSIEYDRMIKAIKNNIINDIHMINSNLH